MLLTRQLLARAESIYIPSRRRARSYQRGERTGVKKGASLEFSDYREYLQGDDLRNIDWSVYARSERLFLKIFLEEQSKNVYFVVDASESMKFGSPSKFEYALSFAALLSYSCLRHYDRPRILIARKDRFQNFAVRSRKEFFSLLPRLEKESCEGEIEWNNTIRRIAYSRLPRGVFFLLSDFYSSPVFDALKTLSAMGNELRCLQILSKEEINPEIRGDLRLLDCESADQSEVSISSSMLKRYQNALAALQSRVKSAAQSGGGSFYSISSNTDLSTVVFQTLRAAGVLA